MAARAELGEEGTMPSRSGRVLTIVAGTLWVLACCGDLQEQLEGLSGGAAGGGATTAEGSTEATGGGASGAQAGPTWGIPERDVEADVGDNAFAVVPQGTSWDVLTWKPGEVTSIQGQRATFDASFLEPVEGTPGSVIVEIPESLGVTRDDILFGDVYASGRPCRVTRALDDKVSCATVWVEEATTLEMTIGKNVIEAPYGLEPMAMVAYPQDRGGAMYLGTVAAVSPTTVWVLTGSGTLEEVSSAAVVPLDLRKRHKLHEELFAVWNDDKFYHARVTKVLDSGLLYEVEYMDELHVQTHAVTVAFWEVTKTITPGEAVSHEVDEEGYTPARSSGGGTYKEGRSSGGRGATPVARPKGKKRRQ